MAGMWTSSRLSRSSSSRPLMPGMRTSNSRQPGRVASKVSRNCCAESYASAAQVHRAHQHRQGLPHGRIVVDDENSRFSFHG